MKKSLLALLALATATLSAAANEMAASKILVNKTAAGLALQGFDPVAYFTDQKPVKGNAKFATDYDGATYQFASAEHREMFLKEPAKYAPAFGGYCGYAASINRLSPIDPAFFQIIDGRLVLQHNQRALDKWNADVSGNLAKANTNWPGLVEKNGTSAKTLVNVDGRGVAVEGFDPVSYFTDRKPIKGDAKIEATYNGALYHFVSQEHREIFEQDPAKYVPAYGGFCGYAASIGKVRPVDPNLWSIIDGRLVLQHSKGAVELWEKDISGNKAKADSYWPRLVIAKAGKKDPIDGLLSRSVLADAN
jgi:YHS domain-containing protein